MKKVFIIFLLGQLLIFSYVSNKVVYDIYGLKNIGDVSLKKYSILEPNPDKLEKLFEKLEENNSIVQIIKMPISYDSKNILYEIYHTKIDSVRKFVSISNNEYKYYNLEKDDFIDSTGEFSTNLSIKKLKNIGSELGIIIQTTQQTSYLSYDDIIRNNLLNFIILFFTTQIIMFIYSISRYKLNAVKSLVGYSPFMIVLSKIKELFLIEIFSILIVIIINVSYYGIRMKLSLFYIIFLFGFLIIVSFINLILLLFTQIFIKRLDIVSAIKNKMFSSKLNTIIQITKIIMIFTITITISIGIGYYNKLNTSTSKINDYKELNGFYSSYGFNSDEYSKLENNSIEYIKTADNAKKMYLDNKKNTYVMTSEAEMIFNESILKHMGQNLENIMNSYERNFIILNKNYLEEYTSVKTNLNINYDIPTILVPKKYKKDDEKIKEFYKTMYENLINYNSLYDNSITKSTINALNIVYIENNYEYKLLSSLQYENDDSDVTFVDSIIVLDNGSFASCKYFEWLSNSQLAFKTNDRDEFLLMLKSYNLEKVLYAYTLLTPFMNKISNYEFLLGQALIFIFMFFITLIFIIYISNYIEINVNNKNYGIKRTMGFGMITSMKKEFLTTTILIFATFGLYWLKINIFIYLFFILMDIVYLIYFYRKIIIKDLYKILNGGN